MKNTQENIYIPDWYVSAEMNDNANNNSSNHE